MRYFQFASSKLLTSLRMQNCSCICFGLSTRAGYASPPPLAPPRPRRAAPSRDAPASATAATARGPGTCPSRPRATVAGKGFFRRPLQDTEMWPWSNLSPMFSGPLATSEREGWRDRTKRDLWNGKPCCAWYEKGQQEAMLRPVPHLPKRLNVALFNRYKISSYRHR